MKRNATAVWNGSLKEGAGKLTTQTTTLKDTQYSFKSRFEEGVGTNPEELIAAAHAGCETKCDIDFVDGTIITSHLTVAAKVKEITEDAFQQLVTKAEKNCPVSKVLNAAISSTATLA